MWIIFFFTVPVFYIIGLVTIIRFFTDMAKPTGSRTSQDLASQLRQIALSESNPDTKSYYNYTAQLLISGPSTGVSMVDTPASVSPASPEPTQPNWTSMDIGKALHQVDNINLILYLGAFLMVVSAGIFVGYNFSVLSGTFKTLLIAGFVALFYVSGLYFYLRMPKLRPAGVTFVAIGLMVMPLVGLAAYNYVLNQTNGGVVWFVTSIVMLGLYLVTLTITRQTYVAYFMAFTTLSLFESMVSLFNLPVYWFGWVMAAAAILLVTVARFKSLWQDVAGSLTITGTIFLPVSLLISLFVIPAHGLAQLGVTLVLSGLFYARLSRFDPMGRYSAGYFTAAALLLPAGLATGLWDSLPHRVITALVMLIAIGYEFWLASGVAEELPKDWRVSLAAAAGFMSLAAAFFVISDALPFGLALAAAALINGVAAARVRQSALALLAIGAALLAPYVLVRLALDPAGDWAMLSAIYLVMVPLAMLWRLRLRGWDESGDAVGIAGYLVTIAVAIIAATQSGSTMVLVTCLASAALLAAASNIEGRVELFYTAGLLALLGAYQTVSIFDLPEGYGSFVLVLVGSLFYAMGYLKVWPQRSEELRALGIAGSLIGAILTVTYSTPHLAPILALGVGSIWLLVESSIRQQRQIAEVAGALMIATIQWWFYYLGDDQTQLYTVPWAVYVAWLGSTRRDQGRAVTDGFVVVSLAILTIPLAVQALSDSGQLYALALIGESLALIFIGMALQYRLITLWGAVALVLEVLYQLRGIFDALPKYVISAGLGLALLVVAIVLLQRRQGGD